MNDLNADMGSLESLTRMNEEQMKEAQGRNRRTKREIIQSLSEQPIPSPLPFLERAEHGEKPPVMIDYAKLAVFIVNEIERRDAKQSSNIMFGNLY